MLDVLQNLGDTLSMSNISVLKIQFTLNKVDYSMSLSEKGVTFWELIPNKKLKRAVASKVDDPKTLKTLEARYAKVQAALA